MEINRLDFHISYKCKNHCIFCSERNRLARFKDKNLSTQEIKNILLAKKKQGFVYVTFTGGEPTLSPSLPFALKLAKLLGFRTCVTTNGYGFSNADYCKEIIQHCDEIMLSSHGTSADTYYCLTGNKESYEIFSRALYNITEECSSGVKKSLFFMSNTVLTKQNAGEIEELYSILAKNPYIRQCLLSYPAPEGGAFKNYADISLPLRKAGRIVENAARIIMSAGKIMRLFGFPACYLGKYSECSNDFFWSPRATVERSLKNGSIGLKEIISEQPIRRRHYLGKCLKCKWHGKCGGFFNVPSR